MSPGARRPARYRPLGTCAALAALLSIAAAHTSCATSEAVAPAPVPTVGRIDIDFTEPTIADGQDVLEVDIQVFDADGRPVDDAELRVDLVIGIDEVKAMDAENLGGGQYRAAMTSDIAGDAMLVVTDLVTGFSEKRRSAFIAGPPALVRLVVGPLEAEGSQLTRSLLGVVEDVRTNPVTTPDADLVLTTDFGTLDPVVALPDGTFSTRLRADLPGTSHITATDAGSGLTTEAEIAFPAVALECHPALHLSEDPAQDRTFPVKVRVFTGAQPLGSYDLLLETNELTSFAGGAVSLHPAFDDPELETVSSSLIRVSQSATDPTEAPGGWLEIADLTFECLGEGNSQVSVVQATLVAASSVGAPDTPLAPTASRNGGGSKTPQERRVGSEQVLLPDAPVLAAICPNKRVKTVCINPIVLQGLTTLPNNFANHVQKIQDNLDQGCCKIEVKTRSTKTFNPPQSYRNEVTKNTNQNQNDDVIQVEWDARSLRNPMQGQIPLNQIHLSDGMADLLCAAAPRADECINVYVVPNDSMVGKFPVITPQQQLNRQAAGVNPPQVSPFAGADIKRQRLKPDGSGNETLRIFRKRAAGGNPVEIPANQCQVNSVVVSPSTLATFKTLKHEVGHMLGLRHPWEYTPQKLQQILASEGQQGSIMRYHGAREIYSRVECEMITQHNSNGYQR